MEGEVLLPSPRECELIFKILKQFPFTFQFIIYETRRIECGDVESFSLNTKEVFGEQRSEMKSFIEECCGLEVAEKGTWFIAAVAGEKIK